MIAAALMTLALAVGPSGQADVTGTWDVSVNADRGTMRFVLAVTSTSGALGAVLTAPTGEKRAATIGLDGAAVTIRFDLDNPGAPVVVVMTGTVDGDAMKGVADFGGRAKAGWTAMRKRARPAPSRPHEQFWQHLQTLCGGAFEGKVVDAPPADTTFAGKRLVMHVRECSPDVIRIPFHVGEDRSRTWVITRTDVGLILKHDHRHEDGTPDKVTQYGGEGRARPGTATRQQFPADLETIALLPEARTNVWTLEIEPGQSFVYALRREGTDRRFRIEFDTTRRVPAPLPPWGAR